MMMILMKSNNNYNNNHLTMQTNSQNWLDIIVAALTNGFLKFLARFSGKQLFKELKIINIYYYCSLENST